LDFIYLPPVGQIGVQNNRGQLSAKNGDAVAAMYIPDGVQVQSRGVATGRAAIRARYL
jgi:hypothetical protein